MISTTERCETILIKRITHVEVKREIHEGNIQRIKLKRKSSKYKIAITAMRLRFLLKECETQNENV